MEFKIFFLLSMLIGVSLGQNLTCTYTNIIVEGETHYGCYLTIINPDGLDDFTTIGGTHAEGRTDADVTAILRNLFASSTTNFPQILCSQFENLAIVDFSWLDVEELSETTLRGCPNLEWLRLWLNEIHTVHPLAFANNERMRYLDLEGNNFDSLDENVFSNLVNLEGLELSRNNFSIQGGLFRNLRNLRLLFLIQNGLEEINQQWFADLENLEVLSFYGNRIREFTDNTFASLRNLIALEISRNPVQTISDNVFRQQTNLQELYMANVGVNEINTRWFESLTNLEALFMYSNNLGRIQENAFDGLSNLMFLDISDSHLPDSAIPGSLFNSLTNLVYLDLSYNLIQNLNAEWFQNLRDLVALNLNFNQVLSLPNGVFEPIRSLEELDLWGNSLKTINRAAFGNIRNLFYVDFDQNVINAIDEVFLRDAEPLFALYLWGNLCTGERFYNFAENRAVFLPRLALCTRNHRFIVETETQAGADYRFFESSYPGLQLRVTSDSTVRIALTSFDIPWNPMLEIVLGLNNNTVSQIIRNQDEVVVNIPTPGILNSGFPSGFRITWSNHVILVTREDQQYPFMAYTMQDWYSVEFYGIQSVDATWYIQPVEAEISPSNV